MMKKILMIVAIIAAIPVAVLAQVEKQVEVTKAYIPNVESASKLAIMPDMTDTVKMRPEIDYTITPLSLSTNLSTRPIRPATVTYWEFNRPKLTYIKLGAGYPSNSVADIYLSSQNRGTGYVVGFLNHQGDYSKVANFQDKKKNAMKMENRAGVAAGKYFGSRILEGQISYDNRLYDCYGADFFEEANKKQRVGYGDAKAQFRFGDQFVDLSRLNFEVGISGALFSFYPNTWLLRRNLEPDYKLFLRDQTSGQTVLSAHAKLARGFGRHRFTTAIDYSWQTGNKLFKGYDQQTLRAALRYGIDGELVHLEAGADYYYDKIATVDRVGHYIIPSLRLDIKLDGGAMNVFLELDGDVLDNSYRSLSQLNPYMIPNDDPNNERLIARSSFINRSSVDYNARFGVAGRVLKDKLSYRLFVGFSVHDNHKYWAYCFQLDNNEVPKASTFSPIFGRQTVTSFNGDLEYRPLSQLSFKLGAHGYLYNDDLSLGNGSPSFEANLGGRYLGRKFSFGISGYFQTRRQWSSQVVKFDSQTPSLDNIFTAPSAVDLRVDFQWHISRTVSLFVEGRNLANAKLYDFAFYRSRGAQFTGGVKLNF